MEPFTTRIPGGPTVRPLRPEDESAVSRLLTDCDDYFVAATGSTAMPADVQSLYYSLPDGVDFDRKHLLVLVHEDRPVGLVDAVEGHPEPATCSVGLFLVEPHARGRGSASGRRDTCSGRPRPGERGASRPPARRTGPRALHSCGA